VVVVVVDRRRRLDSAGRAVITPGGDDASDLADFSGRTRLPPCFSETSKAVLAVG